MDDILENFPDLDIAPTVAATSKSSKTSISAPEVKDKPPEIKQRPPIRRKPQLRPTERRLQNKAGTRAVVQNICKAEDINANKEHNAKRWHAKEETLAKALAYPPNTLVRSFRFVFDHFDTNNDGMISTYQMLQALNFMKMNIVAKELSDILKGINFDVSQQLSFDDFLQVLTSMKRDFSEFFVPGDNAMFSMESDPMFKTMSKALNPTDPFSVHSINNFKQPENIHVVGNYMNSVRNEGIIGKTNEKTLDNLRKSSKSLVKALGAQRYQAYSKLPYDSTTQYSSHDALNRKARGRMASAGKVPSSSSKAAKGGRPWFQHSIEAAVISTNPAKLAQFAPYERLSFNDFVEVRKATNNERQTFLEEMNDLSNRRAVLEWKRVMPDLIYPSRLRERYRQSYAAYSNLNPSQLPATNKTSAKVR